MARPVFRCAECGHRPRVKGRTRCRVCLTAVYASGAKGMWKRRKAVSRLLGGRTEGPAPAGSVTPADLDRLMADADAAAERALKLAATLSKPKP